MSRYDRGSSRRILDWTARHDSEFTRDLCRMVNLPSFFVTDEDFWMPRHRKTDKEAIISNLPDSIVPAETKQELKSWWLRHRGNTPNWDFFSTCTLGGERAFLSCARSDAYIRRKE